MRQHRGALPPYQHGLRAALARSRASNPGITQKFAELVDNPRQPRISPPQTVRRLFQSLRGVRNKIGILLASGGLLRGDLRKGRDT